MVVTVDDLVMSEELLLSRLETASKENFSAGICTCSCNCNNDAVFDKLTEASCIGPVQ